MIDCSTLAASVRAPIWMEASWEYGMSPFDEGVVAAETGMSKDDNPYQKGTAAHSDWDAGFASCKEADEATELDHD